MKKDKQKVIGEEVSEERLRSFLELKGPKNEPDDYHILTQAYRHLRVEDFARFVQIFKSDGRNIEVASGSGVSFKEEIASHRNGAAYAECLE